MTSTTKFLASTLALTLASLATPNVSHAAEATTLKPLQGISFASASGERGVGYFQKADGGCKVVLSLTADPSTETSRGFTAIRHEKLVPAGERSRHVGQAGSFEFACQVGAIAMGFKYLDNVADVGRH